MSWLPAAFSSSPSSPAKEKRFAAVRMASLPLTFRNLTSIPVEVKLLERYESLESGHSSPRPAESMFSNVTSTLGLNYTARPSPTQVADTAQSFARNDVNIRIEPFTTLLTDIKLNESGPLEILRLTFELDGQRYRIDTPSLSKTESIPFTPLDQSPRHQITGVFLPEQSYLSLFSSGELNCWMKNLRDETPLSALSLAGTHNSPTHHKALPSVRCQAAGIREQLDNGVRFFDVRVQAERAGSPNLILVHSVFPISLTGTKYFRENLLSHIWAFLDENPSETLIMSVKREGTGDATDQQISRILWDHYAGPGKSPNAHRWYTDPRIPSLGSARGKIVLMRRFGIDDSVREEGIKQHGDHGAGGWAIDASNWADNTAYDMQQTICVQDFYEVLETENIDKKLQYVKDQLARAAGIIPSLPGINTDLHNPIPPGPFYLNFLSASNFWKVGCWPERIAAKLNPGIISWLVMNHGRAVEEGKKDGCMSTGIVVTDWVGAEGNWDLIRCIVGMNAKLEAMEQRM